MKVPKLLYHGTAAMSVWASHRHWQAVGKLRKQDPQLVEKQLRGEKALNYYQRFGPLYPHQKYTDRSQKALPCLVKSFATAWVFARKWKGTFYPDAQGIYFRKQSRFFLSAGPRAAPGINELMQSYGINLPLSAARS